MKIRTSLLVACLLIISTTIPAFAEMSKIASPKPTSTRMKNLEVILRESGLCKHYPVVVKILPDNVAVIATYGDRRLSDKEIKLLAIHMAKLVSSNANKIVEVRVRLYDPASIKYWKDIKLSAAQIGDSLKSVAEQEQILSSIKVVNNFGLVDGPNLESRVDLYKQILKLRHAGVDVQPFIVNFEQIETAEKNKQNINAKLAQLSTSVIEAEPTIKPISSDIANTDLDKQLQQQLKQADDDVAAAQKEVQESQQEIEDMAVPEAYDLDARTRYETTYEAVQKKIEAGLQALQEARQDRERVYEQLMRAGEHY